MSLLESQIAEWRTYLADRPELSRPDAEELEDHLRTLVAELESAGLDADEAFLIAVKRIGAIDEVSREFAREHSDRLWKQLMVPQPDRDHDRRRSWQTMLLFAVAAAIWFKLPAAAGISFDDHFYAVNAGWMLIVPLAAYFAWTRRITARQATMLASPFVAGAIILNAYPFTEGGSTEVLAAMHLPVVLWLTAGIVYAGGDWRRRRMDYVRFTGEWFIYFVLLALGGMVLIAATVETLAAIGVSADEVVFGWVLPFGIAGSVIVAAWLVEAKQSIIENLAPVLTAVFSPLFALMFTSIFIVMAVSGSVFSADRDVLILFDMLLVIVLGLSLYSISARPPERKPSLGDYVQLWLVVAALALDAFGLVAIGGRIVEFGLTPNRVAGLGLNLLLAVSLAVTAWLMLRFVRGRSRFAPIERWQTRYLPIFAAWAALVVIILPPVFGFD